MFPEFDAEELEEGARADELPLVADAVAAALAADRDQRAWALVSLAVELTGHGYHSEALDVLRAAIKVEGSERSRVAALAVAAVVRCRQGEHEEAIRISELVLASTGESELLRVVARNLATGAEESGDLLLRGQADRLLEWADLEDAVAGAEPRPDLQ